MVTGYNKKAILPFLEVLKFFQTKSDGQDMGMLNLKVLKDNNDWFGHENFIRLYSCEQNYWTPEFSPLDPIVIKSCNIWYCGNKMQQIVANMIYPAPQCCAHTVPLGAAGVNVP